MSLSQRIRLKLKREASYLAWDIRHLLGLDKSFYKKARGARIVIYHGICRDHHTRFNLIFLKLKTLEQHLQLYQQYFNVISLDDYYQQRFSKDKFNICLTFDDGYANNHKYVLSLLEKYQIPATFFITAIRHAGFDILWNDFLGIVSKYGPDELLYNGEQFYKNRFNKYISKKSGISMVEMLRIGGFDVKAQMMELLYPLTPFRESKLGDEGFWLQMTETQIRELSASKYVGIGSHGYYHNDLVHIALHDAVDEMARSKSYLENLTGKPVNSIAFPYGTYTPDVVQAAKNCGYTQLLAMDYHFEHDHSDELMRERFTVNPFISPANQMRATISRKYE